MMTPSERAEKISKISSLPHEAESAVKGLTDKQLDTPYRDGGWTPRQVIHHLADSHMNAFIRMKLILTENNPTLKAYDQEEWAKLPDTMKLPVQGSLSILKGLHERWTALLQNATDGDRSRTAQHPESGTVTLESLLNTYARHGANHCQQITKLREARGW